MSIGPWDFGGLDIVILLLLLISGLMSMGRGFMRELVSIVALIVGLGAALFLFGRFQGTANDLIQPSWLANGALAFGAFALAYMLVTFVLRSGTKKLQGREPGLIDRLMGLGFGVFRGLLMASLFVIVLTMASRDDTAPEWVQNATFYPVLKPITAVMMSLPFARAKEVADETIERGRGLDPEAGQDPRPEPQDDQNTLPQKSHRKA